MTIKAYDALKIYAACGSLGIGRKDALVYARIHDITKKGKLGVEALEHLAAELPFGIRESSPSIEHFLAETGKIMSDAVYREEKYRFYTEQILPKLGHMSYKRVLGLLKSSHNISETQ